MHPQMSSMRTSYRRRRGGGERARDRSPQARGGRTPAMAGYRGSATDAPPACARRQIWRDGGAPPHPQSRLWLSQACRRREIERRSAESGETRRRGDRVSTRICPANPQLYCFGGNACGLRQKNLRVGRVYGLCSDQKIGPSPYTHGIMRVRALCGVC